MEEGESRHHANDTLCCWMPSLKKCLSSFKAVDVVEEVGLQECCECYL